MDQESEENLEEAIGRMRSEQATSDRLNDCC
jgi:hypothetical protein